MKEASFPSDEIERISDVWSLDILDTPSEERFDRITMLASQIFGTPISVLNIVDRDRGWYKAVCGLDNREEDRLLSFCGHAILQDELMVVEDTLQDTRFADNPLVNGKGIRFYAGKALKGMKGKRVGTLCIKDTRPRRLGKQEHETLSALAAWAEFELVSRGNGRKLLQRLSEEARDLADSLDKINGALRERDLKIESLKAGQADS